MWLVASILLLAGCGESDEPTGPVEPAAGPDASESKADPQLVAALGDSITAGSPLWDPDPEIRERIGSALNERSQFEFWAERRRPGLELRNCGVFGERTDQIAARLEECAGDAGTLIVQGGINDIAQGRPVAQAAEDLDAMVEAGQAMGLDVAIADVLPWNNGYPVARQPIDELNGMIARIAKRRDVPLMPFYATLEDPENPGRMRSAWTDDGDHPSVAGYRRLAERAVLLNLP